MEEGWKAGTGTTVVTSGLDLGIQIGPISATRASAETSWLLQARLHQR